MSYYIKPSGDYYEGDMEDQSDQAVPQRPSSLYQWVGGAWVEGPPPVPGSCTPAQGLTALYDVHRITEENLFSSIEQIENGDERYRTRVAFTRSTVWERASPSMQTLAKLLELNDEQLSALFIYSNTLTP